MLKFAQSLVVLSAMLFLLGCLSTRVLEQGSVGQIDATANAVTDQLLTVEELDRDLIIFALDNKTTTRRFDMYHTYVYLTLRPGEEIASGVQRLEFFIYSSKTGESTYDLTFDSGVINVSSVTFDGEPIAFTKDAKSIANGQDLKITIPDPFPAGLSIHALEFEYEISLTRGFINRPSLTASGYFACDWMLCNQEDFADRYTTTLVLDIPDTMKSVGPGDLTQVTPVDGGRVQHEWRTRGAFPAYINSFAVGDFQSISLSSPCEVELIVLADNITDEVRQAFSPTCAMLSFFEQKAGIVFPADRYYQLYIPDSRAAQEAISHSTIGSIFLDPILNDPQEDWVIAHELAHQWWGNRVTAANLKEFWLNEGLVTYMVAAWKEFKWGRAAYEREIMLNRSRWKRRIEESGDVPIAFKGEYKSTGARFSIQYSKGAVFLNILREFMGDEAFWAGIRTYTRNGFNNYVTSQEFELAMQEHTDKPLKPLFIKWVYGE